MVIFGVVDFVSLFVMFFVVVVVSPAFCCCCCLSCFLLLSLSPQSLFANGVARWTLQPPTISPDRMRRVAFARVYCRVQRVDLTLYTLHSCIHTVPDTPLFTQDEAFTQRRRAAVGVGFTL